MPNLETIGFTGRTLILGVTELLKMHNFCEGEFVVKCRLIWLPREIWTFNYLFNSYN
jgi:hypothetical protein